MTRCRLIDVQALQVPGRRGYCLPGTQKWFIKHGLSWETFLREGLDSSALNNIPDPMAKRVVENAQRREESEQHGRQ